MWSHAEPWRKRPGASGAQCRAARALLRWSQAKLAVESDVARKTVADFEGGTRLLNYRTQLALTAALERAGVMFVWEGGDGVHLSRSTQPAVSSGLAAASASGDLYGMQPED